MATGPRLGNGIPGMPPAPPVKDVQLMASFCHTRLKPMVAMARYAPLRRREGMPRRIPIVPDRAPATSRSIGKGTPNLVVSKAEV